jgi:hypothetical protein
VCVCVSVTKKGGQSGGGNAEDDDDSLQVRMLQGIAGNKNGGFEG